MPLLPHVPDAAAYRQAHRSAAPWPEAARAIATRHGLAHVPLERSAAGGNVVFLAGDRHVIKLFAPIYAAEHGSERALLSHVAGRLPVATPEVLAVGELEGWPYLILNRVAGVPLDRVLGALDARERVRVGEQLGALAAALHELPLGPLADDWAATYAELRASCVSRRAAQGLGAACLSALPAQLDALAPAPGSRRVFVHADLTGGNVFADEHGRVVALIDFGDALVADPRYELAGVGAGALRSEREPTRAALRAYGIAPTEIDAALADALTAFTFLHRYGDLAWLPGTSARRPSDWTDAVRTLWPIA